MKRYVIKNGQLICTKNNYDFEKLDIYVEDGIIKEIAKDINIDVEVIDAKGAIVSPGLIDIHTHCYKFGPIGTEADSLGIERGATTIFDAGTAGANNIDNFRDNDIKNSKTKIYSFLNVASTGLETLSELTDMNNINDEEIEKAIERNKDIIIGLKARASSSVVGKLGIEPIRKAKELSKKYKLPLVVHLGNYPPAIEDVLNLMEKGDIATHVFHGKPNGILDEDGNIKQVVLDAKARGVLFDVGHGSESFSFRVFEKALSKEFYPDLISTDLYYRNMNGPVYNLANVLTKVINCGVNINKVFEMVTNVPAELFNLSSLGELSVGKVADFSILKLDECQETLVDSKGDELEVRNKLNMLMTISSREDSSEVFRHTREQN